MIPRYAVFNEVERDDFEKDYHLSYGYGSVDIFYDIEEAIDEAEFFGLGFIVEEISEEGREIVHRV